MLRYFKLETILFLLILNSCAFYKNVKQEMNTKIDLKTNQKMFFLDSLSTMLPMNFEGKKHFMALDLGANSTVLFKTKFLLDSLKLSKNAAKGVDRIKLEVLKYNVKEIQNDIFDIKNKNILILNSDTIQSCNKNIDFDGLIGTDLLMYSDKVLFLDYKQNNIMFLDSMPRNNLKMKLISSKFSLLGQIKVKLLIAGVEKYFTLDTGYSDYITTNDLKIKENLQKNLFDEQERLMRKVGNITISNKCEIYKNFEMKMDTLKIKNAHLEYSKDIKINNIGMKFIKNFNWWIDFKNQKIFVEEIKINPEIVKQNRIFVAIIKNKITICNKPFICKLNLKDQITSVNAKKVTSKNICEIQSFLNETKDWSTLQLEVVPANN
jgi:hypothetical protein